MRASGWPLNKQPDSKRISASRLDVGLADMRLEMQNLKPFLRLQIMETTKDSIRHAPGAGLRTQSGKLTCKASFAKRASVSVCRVDDWIYDRRIPFLKINPPTLHSRTNRPHHAAVRKRNESV
jgi:hypothetical protein